LERTQRKWEQTCRTAGAGLLRFGWDISAALAVWTLSSIELNMLGLASNASLSFLFMFKTKVVQRSYYIRSREFCKQLLKADASLMRSQFSLGFNHQFPIPNFPFPISPFPIPNFPFPIPN